MKTVGVGVAALAAVLAFAFAGCSSEEEEKNAVTPKQEAPKPLVFGMAIALTGDLKGFGQPGQNAAKVAENQLNALGGILGRPVKFEIDDDQTQEQAAIDVVTRFVNENVAAIIGPTNSPQALKTHQLAFDKQILMISATASTPALTGCPEGQTTGCSQPLRDRYFFRTTASHKLQGKTIAIFANKGPTPGQSCKKMAMIHNDDGYANPIAAEVAAQLTAFGGQIVADIKIPPAVKADYKEEAKQVVGLTPDCQLLVMFPPAGIQYLKDFKSEREADTAHDWSKFYTIGANGLKIGSFLVDGRQNPADPASPTIGEGAYLTIADTNPPTSEYQAFKNIYTQQFPLEDPAADLPTYTANIYDACILPALAIQHAGTADDRAKIRDSLFAVSRGLESSASAYGPDQIPDLVAAIKSGRDVNYKGASGPVDFDDGGDVLNDFVVWRVENGAFKEFSRVGVDQLKLKKNAHEVPPPRARLFPARLRRDREGRGPPDHLGVPDQLPLQGRCHLHRYPRGDPLRRLDPQRGLPAARPAAPHQAAAPCRVLRPHHPLPLRRPLFPQRHRHHPLRRLLRPGRRPAWPQGLAHRLPAPAGLRAGPCPPPPHRPHPLRQHRPDPARPRLLLRLPALPGPVPAALK